MGITKRSTARVLQESVLWSIAAILFSNIIFSYFVFNHEFGGGMPIELGADGYFVFSTSIGFLFQFFAFITALLFLWMSLLFFFISRKRSKRALGKVLFVLVVLSSASALINYEGVHDGLYDSGHIFRDAYDEYSLKSMYVFSWIFTILAVILAILLLYFFELIGLLFRNSVRLLGSSQKLTTKRSNNDTHAD